MQQVQGSKSDFLRAALWYRKKSLSVIPCRPKAKIPIIEWGEFQKRLPTEEEIREWWRKWPDANVAIVLGEVSGLVVLDIDDEEAIKGYPIPVTAEAISGSGKPHFYFHHVKGMRNYKRSNGNGGEAFSIRGDGEIIIAPGSIHPNGNPYRWVQNRRPDQVEVADPTEWMLDLTLVNEEEEEAAAYYRKHDGDIADGLREYVQELKKKINFSDFVERKAVTLTERHKRYDHFDNPWGGSKGKKCFTVWKEENVATHWHEPEDKRSYDIIKFIQKRRSIGFKEALNFLADYTGIDRYNFDVDGRVVEQSEEGPHSPTDIKEIQFPEEAWVGLFKDYRTLVEPTTEAPVSFHFGTITTILGARLKRSVHVHYGGNVYPNFYNGLIGRTGTEKKDTAINRARKFLVQDELLVEVIGTGSAEGLLQCFMKEETEILGNGKARITLKPVEGRCLLFTEYEFSRFLSKSLQKGSNLPTTFTQLYDCPDEYSPPTRNNRIIAIKPVLSFLTGSTLASCEKYLNDEHIGSGFLNRFMFFIDETDKLIAFPPKIDDEGFKTFSRAIDGIIKWAAALPDGEIKVSPEAKARWEEFYTEWQTKRRASNPLLADMWSRIPNHIWKIGLLYAVSDQRQEISQDDLEFAILVGDYLEKTSAIIVSHLAKSKTTKIEEYILNKLRTVHPYGLTKNQIHMHVGGKVNVTALERTLDGLKKMNLISETEIKCKDGKRRPGYVAIV